MLHIETMTHEAPLPHRPSPTSDTLDERSMDVLWNAVRDRDERFDGLLYYGVQTTGIYCRPVCPSRRPRRRNVVFYATPEAAEKAGLRPCKRCRPAQREGAGPDEQLALRACRSIEDHEDLSPPLPELAAELAVSERHLRDVFDRVLGVSPSRYAHALKVGRLRLALRAGTSVTDAVYEAGFGSPSRLYEQAERQLGMTPATYRRGGLGAVVHYQVAASRVGHLLVAGTEKGLCAVRIGAEREALVEELYQELGRAELHESSEWIDVWMRTLVEYLEGSRAWPALPVDVRATAFQAKVWAALRRIPAGTTLTYAEVAREIGEPRAARAVGRACATNPVALAVPCHRVVAQGGALRGYRWGEDVKRELLKLEETPLRDA